MGRTISNGKYVSRVRGIRKILKSEPTTEGAGVHLKRAFGYYEVPQLDPFLMLDDFRSNDPDEYSKGFPWHPHRGIETITYMLAGEVEHGDSMGNKGTIRAGDVQWMTAGSGIIHQEMPKGDAGGRMWGFQLWANLPASHKMMSPRYREVSSVDIPEIIYENGTKIRVICGNIGGTEGPVKDIVTEPEYLDVTIQPNSIFTHRVQEGNTVFAYVIEGEGFFDETRSSHVYKVEGDNDLRREDLIGNERLVLYDDGDEVHVLTADIPVRFLLISGKPIKEPVAWQGPIVMNFQEEVRTAFDEYNNGTFIKDTAG